MPHWFYILFLFTLGACVGSFLNVVVWRLPRGESLVNPPSHCPNCNTPLAWYDNLPVIGWLKLAGRCRYCNQPISPRYPIVETVTGLLFVFYYVMFYIVGMGPCPPNMTVTIGEIHLRSAPLDWHTTWPIYFLYMFMVAGLLAASLVDFELYIIPEEIPIALAIVGILVHAIVDKPNIPGALNVNPTVAALGAGGGVGLLISILLRRFDKLPKSFPHGDPILEVDRPAIEREIAEAKARGEEVPELPPSYTRAQIRAEMRIEMLFLMPPMLLAALAWMLVNWVPGFGELWSQATSYYWVTGMLGAVFGGCVGAFVVWITRILGTFGFGKVAMGLGDVDLMFGVGCIIGAGAATVTFFIAPFFGIILALYLIITRQKRELALGPYLSMAAAAVLLFSCPILAWLTPGMMGLRQALMDRLGI